VRVARTDIGTLRKPEITAQGFLKVEGYASKAGVFVYHRGDGTEVRELRPRDEVFSLKALSSYEGAPLTLHHPSEKVTAKNAKRHSIGTVLQPARRDGDHVAVTMMICDADAIEAAKRGTSQLSSGYTVEIEDKAGIDPEFGRYDCVQRNIEINHQALVDRARAGDTARIRLDRADDGYMIGAAVLTSIVDGHQHSLDMSDTRNGIGSTSWANSEGSESGHSHEWVRNTDGSIAIAVNEGHTHTLLSASDKTDGRSKPTKTKGQGMPPDKSKSNKTDATPNLENILQAAKVELATVRTRADSAEAELAKQQTRADVAEGQVVELRKLLEDAQADRNDVAAAEERAAQIRVLEDEKKELQEKLDAANDPEAMRLAVKARVSLERISGPVLNLDSMDDMTDREIMIATLEKCGRKDLADEPDAKIAGRFSELMSNRSSNQKELDKLILSAKKPEPRSDVRSKREEYLEKQNNSWKPAQGSTQKGA